LQQFPIIKYFDPSKSGTTLAARLGWKLFQKSQILEQEREFWPKRNVDVDVLIVDRNCDWYAPLLHNFSFEGAIHDLLRVKDGNRVYIGGIDSMEKPILVNEEDEYYTLLRHQSLGDVGETILKFIESNPAASSYFGRSNAITTADIKDQIYAISDGNKIVDYRIIFFALISFYEKNNLEIAADLEQLLATSEYSNRDLITEDIIGEVLDALTHGDLTYFCFINSAIMINFVYICCAILDFLMLIYLN
jgi:hypothetical protein